MTSSCCHGYVELKNDFFGNSKLYTTNRHNVISCFFFLKPFKIEFMLKEGLYTKKPGRATLNALAADKRVGIINIFHFPRPTLLSA